MKNYLTELVNKKNVTEAAWGFGAAMVAQILPSVFGNVLGKDMDGAGKHLLSTAVVMGACVVAEKPKAAIITGVVSASRYASIGLNRMTEKKGSDPLILPVTSGSVEIIPQGVNSSDIAPTSPSVGVSDYTDVTVPNGYGGYDNVSLLESPVPAEQQLATEMDIDSIDGVSDYMDSLEFEQRKVTKPNSKAKILANELKKYL